MKVKVISLPYIFQVLYILCFTRPRYQVSVYRTIGPLVCICKTKTQISFAVTAKLISAFVFATQIVQSLYFLNPKFQASSHLLRLYSLVCVGPGRKPLDLFSQNEAHISLMLSNVFSSYQIGLLLLKKESSPTKQSHQGLPSLPFGLLVFEAFLYH